MCGIVALISPSVPIRTDLLSAMRDRLIHRGPDNGANWIHAGGRVALAHRRLSVLDASVAANQPMPSGDGSRLIVFNGEIYNYIELRQELENSGRRFRTKSDTEVLLAAIEEWGEKALLRLNGMFAFACWDEKSRRLMVARDRFGEKPLFIGRGAHNTLVIASEMKAILLHPAINPSINETSVSMYTAGNWYESDQSTFFDKIERLPAAHAAWFAEDGAELRRWRYWTPDYLSINHDIGPREAIGRFGELLQRSVDMRLRSDVTVGSSLSGGLDSSSIVGILAKARNQSGFSQNTFSACFPEDPVISEHSQIEDVISYTGAASFLVNPGPYGLQQESRQLHWHQEEPFLSASIYLQWCVARLAGQQKTTVVLDGQGADELLAGYQYYFREWQLDLMQKGKHALALRESTKFNRRLRITGRKYGRISRRFNPSIAYTSRELVKMNNCYPALSSYYYDAGVPRLMRGLRLRRKLSESMLYNSLPLLLRYADRNSMAFSRETRLPFLDYDLVDFCIGLPDNMLICNGWQKWILRMSTANIIPDNIRWRVDKVGYAAPLDNWLRNELYDWASERIMDSRLSAMPGYDRNWIQTLWYQHQQKQADRSWELWQWISLAEWLALHDAGSWKGHKA